MGQNHLPWAATGPPTPVHWPAWSPEIGMWPSPLEQLPEGRNYVGWHNWMWVNNPGRNTWGPITKTVTESGYSVTATAMVAGVT